MKTTIDIRDELLARAEQYTRNTGHPLHAVVEEGLCHTSHASFQQPLPSARPERGLGRRG